MSKRITTVCGDIDSSQVGIIRGAKCRVGGAYEKDII